MSQKRTIGLVVAIEMNAVLKKYGVPTKVVRQSGYTVHVYENDDFILYAADSGAGEISAAMTTQFLIDTFHVDMILNFGVVGALTEDAKTAELCVVERVIHYAFSTNGWLNLPDGQYPHKHTTYFETDVELMQLAKEIHPELRPVICASADCFVDREEDKRALRNNFGAHICEMEAAGVVITAERSGVPCLLLKAVSDSLVGGGKEFLKELDRVSQKCFDIVDDVIRAL